jgi:hypothetical protein
MMCSYERLQARRFKATTVSEAAAGLAKKQVTRDLLGSRFPRPDERMAGYPGGGIIWGDAGFAPGTRGTLVLPTR